MNIHSYALLLVLVLGFLVLFVGLFVVLWCRFCCNNEYILKRKRKVVLSYSF